MKSLIRLTAFFFIASLVACSSSREPFSPEGGGFSVQMPRTPEEQSKVLDTPAGPLKLNMYLCKAGNWVYMVGYTEHEKLGGDAEEILDGARNGAVKIGNSKLISEDSISLDGNPGRDLRMEAPNGLRMRVKIILAGNRLYQVGVVTPKNDSYSPRIEKFLTSFRLTQAGKDS
jgi:hypothetical protein